MSFRNALRGFVLGLALLAPSLATAQTFDGVFSAGTNWYRYDAACTPEASARNVVAFVVSLDVAGTYTFTANRAGGANIVIDAYRNSLPHVLPCASYRVAAGPVAAGTSSIQFHSSSTPGFVWLLVSSANTADVGAFSVTVSGPAAVNGDSCASPPTVSPATQSAPIGGGAYATVVTPPNSPIQCSAVASRSVPAWITGIPASISAATTVNYTVAANSGGPRSARISFGGSTLDVSQAGTCTYSVPTPTIAVSGAGAASLSGSVNVNSGCPYTATTSTPWITILNGSGTGSGSFTFSVATNTGAARSGTITVGGRTVTVNQAAACTYSLGTTTLTPGRGGLLTSIEVTTQSGCPRTGTTTSDWVTTWTPGNDTGSGPTEISVILNEGPARSATITYGTATLTIDQANGCTVSVPTASTQVGAAGTTSTFAVTTHAGCDFTATAHATWLSATAGSGSVSYTVAPSTTASRTGVITVTSTSTQSAASFTVNQSTGCVATLGETSGTSEAAGGTRTIAASTDAGCPLGASSSASFVRDLAITATGVSFTVDPNAGPARTATIAVSSTGGPVSTYTLMQSSGCVADFGTSTVDVAPEGDGAQAVWFVSGAGCEFTASSDVAWFSIAAPPVDGGGLTLDVAPNAGPARAGTLALVATDSGLSSSVTIRQASTLDPPTILANPHWSETTLREGSSIVLSVVAEGDALDYVWRRNGIAIPGEGSASLVLSSVGPDDAGTYDVVVSNAAGSVTSSSVTFSVVPRDTGGCSTSATAGSPTALFLTLALGVVLRIRRRSGRTSR